jgi:hypothetical protein
MFLTFRQHRVGTVRGKTGHHQTKSVPRGVTTATGCCYQVRAGWSCNPSTERTQMGGNTLGTRKRRGIIDRGKCIGSGRDGTGRGGQRVSFADAQLAATSCACPRGWRVPQTRWHETDYNVNTQTVTSMLKDFSSHFTDSKNVKHETCKPFQNGSVSLFPSAQFVSPS